MFYLTKKKLNLNLFSFFFQTFYINTTAKHNESGI